MQIVCEYITQLVLKQITSVYKKMRWKLEATVN